jgi:hypothetical protein
MNTPKVFTVVCYNPFLQIKTEHQRFGSEEFILLQGEYTASKNPEYYVSITTNEDPDYHHLIQPKQLEFDRKATKEGTMEVIDFLIKWSHDLDIEPTPVAHRVSDKGVPCESVG